MAKTRLNNADREHIANAIISHKYAGQAIASQKEGAILAVEAYERFYGKDIRDKMAAMPTGSFPTDHSIEVAVNGQKFSLYFASHWRDHELLVYPKDTTNNGGHVFMPFLYKHQNSDPKVSLLDSDEFAVRLAAYRDERKRLIDERPKMQSKLEASLGAYKYFDDLVTAFPEAEHFIAARWRERPEGGSPGVPAIQLKDLARELDLPPVQIPA